jgi:hypothetical protein
VGAAGGVEGILTAIPLPGRKPTEFFLKFQFDRSNRAITVFDPVRLWSGFNTHYDKGKQMKKT